MTDPRLKTAAWVLVIYLALHLVILAPLAVYAVLNRPDPDGFGAVYLSMIDSQFRFVDVIPFLLSPVLGLIGVTALWKDDMRSPRAALLWGSVLGAILAAVFYFALVVFDQAKDLVQGTTLTEEQVNHGVMKFSLQNFAVFAFIIFGILGANASSVQEMVTKWFGRS